MKTLFTAAAIAVLSILPAHADSGRASSAAVSAPVVVGSAVAGSVVAVPLIAVGVVGGALIETSADALSSAARSNRPLRVTEQTIITRRTPADAMKEQTQFEEEKSK